MNNIFKYFFIYDGIHTKIGEDGFLRVILNNKANFINKIDGKLLSPTQWFNDCSGFSCGYAVVELNQKYNWLGVDGQFLMPNQWVDWAGDFHKGMTNLCLGNKWNFIKTNGELLFPNQWFDDAYLDYERYEYEALLNRKVNKIRPDGNFVYDAWIDNASIINDKDYNANGLCVGTIDGELVALNNGKAYKIKELIDNYENRQL